MGWEKKVGLRWSVAPNFPPPDMGPESLDLLQGMKGLFLAVRETRYWSFSWTLPDMESRGSHSSGGNQTGLHHPESGLPFSSSSDAGEVMTWFKAHRKRKEKKRGIFVSAFHWVWTRWLIPSPATPLWLITRARYWSTQTSPYKRHEALSAAQCHQAAPKKKRWAESSWGQGWKELKSCAELGQSRVKTWRRRREPNRLRGGPAEGAGFGAAMAGPGWRWPRNPLSKGCLHSNSKCFRNHFLG